MEISLIKIETRQKLLGVFSRCMLMPQAFGYFYKAIGYFITVTGLKRIDIK